MSADGGSETVVLMVDGAGDVLVRRVSRRAADLEMVDALARLQLAARRHGWSIQLRDPSRELRDLLELVGLTDVVHEGSGCAPNPRRQVGGEEAGERGG